jgi:dipeptidyl aminopeptidase/acylaminoacyl peptidase
LVVEPELYQCAIAAAGVYDWEAMRKQDAKRFEEDIYRLYTLADNEAFAACSPINQIDAIQKPIFIYHGKSDLRVDSSQAKSFAKAPQKKLAPQSPGMRDLMSLNFRKS